MSGLIARSAQLAQLDDLLDTVIKGQLQIVFIADETGIVRAMQ